MKSENNGMPNKIKYSIWETRTDEHQPAVEKNLTNQQRFKSKTKDRPSN
jgi:hypothetical protein